jgi:hypothetical protein
MYNNITLEYIIVYKLIKGKWFLQYIKNYTMYLLWINYFTYFNKFKNLLSE